MSSAVAVIAKTYDHADRFASEIFPTLRTTPIRGSLAQAEHCLRGMRNGIIYLVDLYPPEIAYIKHYHESRNTIFVVYWEEHGS